LSDLDDEQQQFVMRAAADRLGLEQSANTSVSVDSGLVFFQQLP
jgi:hypothetical protein